MVELRTRKRDMGGDGGNHHQELGLKRISCARQFTIPDTAGTSPDRVCNDTDTRSPQPNQASGTPDFPYPLVSSTSFSSSSPISLFLIHNSTIIAEHTVKSSLSISPYHDRELTPSTAYTEYKNTPSTAFTQYSIHPVRHTPSTASTEDCVFSLYSHDYELTPECSFSFRCASLHNRPPSASSPWELKGKVTLSHSNGYELTNQSMESQHLGRCPWNASKYWSNLARLRPPRSHDHGLQVHLQTRTITASKCISTLAQSWLPSASPNSLDHSLQVYI